MKTKKSIKASASVERKRPDRTPVPVVADLTPEEVQAGLAQLQYHSPLNKVLDTVAVGQGKKLQGELGRIKAAISGFNSRSGKRFVVRPSGENGFVLAIRIS
jgi:hypothetical protein